MKYLNIKHLVWYFYDKVKQKVLNRKKGGCFGVGAEDKWHPILEA